MRIRNYTAHPIILIGKDGKEYTFDPVYEVRLNSDVKVIDMVRDGNSGLLIPLLEITEQDLHNAPPVHQDTLCIVSSLVSAFAQSRDDLVAPSRVARDGGHVKKAKALAKPRPKVG